MHEKVKYLYPAKNGRWKYMRDVPKHLQVALGRKRWDYSLGSNRIKALQQWATLIEEHDRLINLLQDEKKKEAFISANAHDDAAYMSQMILNYESDLTFAFNGDEVVFEDSKPTPATEGWIRLEGRYEGDPKKTKTFGALPKTCWPVSKVFQTRELMIVLPILLP